MAKVTRRHLDRKAFLYVRQAVPCRDFERDDTGGQYALRARAVALGWPPERIVVIDSDIGRSGWNSGNREGFRRLLDEVGKGNAGLLMARDMSRFSRNLNDGGWRRLLWLCSLHDTLLLDEDAIFDLRNAEDRLLLGLEERTGSRRGGRARRPNPGRDAREAVDGRQGR
jgi:DNA invertase Pin-like site-specific DNA recombinase